MISENTSNGMLTLSVACFAFAADVRSHNRSLLAACFRIQLTFDGSKRVMIEFSIAPIEGTTMGRKHL